MSDPSNTITLPKGIAHYIEHNDHVTVYQPVADYLRDANLDVEDSTPEDFDEILRTGELWLIRWYSHTPVGYYTSIAATLDRALTLANVGLTSDSQRDRVQ